MDEIDALECARQLREHLNYTGDGDTFDQAVKSLVLFVVVEHKPDDLFLLTQKPLPLIAAAVRGKLKK